METLFPWEAPEIVEDYFSGSYLFLALHRLYKDAYFGQGFQLSENCTRLDTQLQNQIDKLPLDIKRIIYSKVWENGKPYNEVIVKNAELLLDSNLHYLLVQYGKLKHLTRANPDRVYAGWNGERISSKIYRFTYGPLNLKNTPVIPDWINSEPRSTTNISFGTLCPSTWDHYSNSTKHYSLLY